jgi:ribokinase
MTDIICIGSSSKDIFFPTREGILTNTPEDMTAQKKITFELGAKYQVEDRYEAIGGCAANVAVGLSRLGTNVGCYTKVGDDMLGKWIIENLQKEGVNTDLVVVELNCKSDLSAIIVDENIVDRVIFYNRDANERLEVERGKISGTKWFFVSALNGDWEKNSDIILEIVKFEQVRLVLNPGQRNIKDDVQKDLELIRASELVMVNKDEAIEIITRLENISGEQLNDEKFLLKTLLGYGPKVVTLTDGHRGAWSFDGKEFLFIEALGKVPKETTGGGDAFTSGFLGAYMKEKTIQECLSWGAVNSANVVGYFGAIDGLLSEQEILKRMDKIAVEKL